MTSEFWTDGYYTAEIISADLSEVFKRISEQDISLSEITAIDDLTVQIRFARNAKGKVGSVCEKAGAKLRIISGRGLYWKSRTWLRRPVLILGILLLTLLTYFLPKRIFFLRVEGNEFTPSALILEAASRCGLSFGTVRSDIRSEHIKNGMLASLPELRWVGVNTRGCVAVISVEEREISEGNEAHGGVSRIVAVKDGIVSSCTVTSGTPLCTPGQVVKEGQTLVSGYSDTGLFIKGTRASGEIYGQTIRKMEAVMPLFSTMKGQQTGVVRNYGLIIGKKRINFSNNSRIFSGLCDKMYEEYYVTLPGGFLLPVALFIEYTVFYEEVSSVDFAANDLMLKKFAQGYLKDKMVSGEIRSAVETLRLESDVSKLTGYYICHEMIGREQTEEMIADYGEDH